MSRRLSEDDRALWQRVAQSTRRLHHGHDPIPEARKAPVAAPEPPSPPAAPPPAWPDFAPRKPATSAVSLDLTRPLAEALRARPPQMDAGLHRRMMRGKLDPEARIDLHGMTRAQAQSALTGFLLSAQGRGLRLVLVITGKGGRERDDDAAPMPRRAGALRHDLPHWLHQPVLRPVVLELRPAHRSHGGEGAFYVYLRRRR